MKFTLSWLKDHLETDAPVEELAEALTALGLEVESVTNPAEALGAFTVGEVAEVKKHPNADRLSVCMVNTGHDTVQVICGAPNVRQGMKGVFAPAGTHIPGTGVDLAKTKIRGVESAGMLCSEREMMLSDDHEGIIELSGDAPVGESFVKVAGLDDPVFDIAITPDRQDCLGVRGIARDLAARGLGTLKADRIKPVKGAFDCPVNISVDEKTDPAPCPAFAGRVVRNVKNGESPDWLKKRLAAIGLRPISALVDITNYLSHDRARPLHVYDLDKLQGDVSARLAEKGESLAALDGKTYTLEGGECAITDASGVIGLGGVMGGEKTGCTDKTENVLIECALFDPVRTARTGRRLGIESDARYRFERGVDPGFVMDGMELATQLVLEFCGGEPSTVVLAGNLPEKRRTAPFRPARVEKLSGVAIDEKESVDILKRLGFEPAKSGDGYKVTIPGWRPDIEGEADLVEEVLRVAGFDRIEGAMLPGTDGVGAPVLTMAQKRARIARRTLAARGLFEAVTYSFMSSGTAAHFRAGDAALLLENPISSELDEMRPCILPNLLDAARRNLHRGQTAIALFEVGPQYESQRPDGQRLMATGLRAGLYAPGHWLSGERKADGYDAKGDAQAVLAAAGVSTDNLQVTDKAPAWYHPGRSGTLSLGPKNHLAFFGEIHPRILKALGLKDRAAGFEVFLDRIPVPRKAHSTGKAALRASDLPAVERDFAFVIGRDKQVQDLVRAVRGAAREFAPDVRIFDVFEGEAIGPEKRSIALSVRLEPRGKTFTDREIDAISEKITEAARKATGAVLRS